MIRACRLRYSLAAVIVAVIGTTTLAAESRKYSVTKGVPYVERSDTALLADIYVPEGDGPNPGVLLVHGGAWMVGNKSRMGHIGRRLAEHGYTAVAIQYRLAPQHVWPAQIEDCKAAVRWMRQNAALYKIDPDHLAGYGYSAGGQLVALLGTTDASCGLEGLAGAAAGDAEPAVCSTRLQCVVAGGAPCDFRALPARSPLLLYWLGGTRLDKPQLYEQASPVSFISKDDPPMFFFHGAVDNIVPLASPRQMSEQLTAAGCDAQMYVVPNAGHGAAFVDPQAGAQAIKFLDAHLKPLSR